MVIKEIEPKTIVKKGRVITPGGVEFTRVTVMGPVVALEVGSEKLHMARVYGREVSQPGNTPWVVIKEVYDRNQRQVILSSL